MEEMNEVKSVKGRGLSKILIAAVGAILIIGCLGLVVYLLVVFGGKIG